MRKYTRVFCFVVAVLATLCVVLNASAQSTPPGRNPTHVPTRAERQAVDIVSLSADKILEIFRESPGLVLAFKRVLVVKAYEQGRLLDPESLSDDAVFEL